MNIYEITQSGETLSCGKGNWDSGNLQMFNLLDQCRHKRSTEEERIKWPLKSDWGGTIK